MYLMQKATRKSGFCGPDGTATLLLFENLNFIIETSET